MPADKAGVATDSRRRRKVRLPWKVDYFRHRVAAMRAAAGVDFSAKFMGLRHGGNTEGGNANLTDTQTPRVERAQDGGDDCALYKSHDASAPLCRTQET